VPVNNFVALEKIEAGRDVEEEATDLLLRKRIAATLFHHLQKEK